MKKFLLLSFPIILLYVSNLKAETKLECVAQKDKATAACIEQAKKQRALEKNVECISTIQKASPACVQRTHDEITGNVGNKVSNKVKKGGDKIKDGATKIGNSMPGFIKRGFEKMKESNKIQK